MSAPPSAAAVLLTVDKLRNANWPKSVLEDLHAMPDGLTLEQVTNRLHM